MKTKINSEPLFEYTIWCRDYSLAGYSETLEYHGTNKEKALKAFKESKNWMGMVRVNIKVLGREEYYSRISGDDEDDEIYYDRDTEYYC